MAEACSKCKQPLNPPWNAQAMVCPRCFQLAQQKHKKKLVKLDRKERQAWEAYQKGKRHHRHRNLKKVMDCMNRRCELLGLFTPEERERPQ